MPFLEVLGYVASGAVFVTFWMKSMIRLRVIGIASNILFFCYGVYGDLIPIMVLHGALLPLNGLRLYQAVRLKRRIREMAHAEFDVKSLLPFMTERRFAQGSYLCRQGDVAHDIFYLAEGRAHIAELDIDIPPGSLVGEIAMFSPDRRRSQTVQCTTDCVVLCIGEEKVLQLYGDNPEFGLYLIKMIVARLFSNLSRAHQAAYITGAGPAVGHGLDAAAEPPRRG